MFYIYLCKAQGCARSTDEGRTGSNCLEPSHWWGPVFPLTSINEREETASTRQIGRGRRETNTVCRR